MILLKAAKIAAFLSVQVRVASRGKALVPIAEIVRYSPLQYR